MLLGLIVFALAGLQWVWPVDRLTTVFVVDLSDSVGTAGRAAALEFVREAIEAKKEAAIEPASSPSVATRSWSACRTS